MAAPAGRSPVEVPRDSYQAALLASVPPDRFRAIADAMVDQAEEGNVKAATLLFDRLLPPMPIAGVTVGGNVQVIVLSAPEIESRREVLRNAIVR